MAKYEKTIIGKFEEVIASLEYDISGSGITMNLVDKSDYKFGDTNIAVRVYDKYFMRNKSRVSLNLTVVGDGNTVFISAIGACGSTGAIFNLSLGAEDNMVEIVEYCIERMK